MSIPMRFSKLGHVIGFALLCVVLVSLDTWGASEALAQSPTETATEALEGEFGVRDIAATSAWASSLHVADWLGPLAPVALSPFFGIALLSGMALYGPSWVTDNALLGASGPLQNPVLFVIFVGLALLTSLPRLTKVSKPFAQAVDRLETYSVIVILLIVKVISSMNSGSEETQVALIQMGVWSFTVDTLLTIAMVINILVVNSVKFFFEFLVWLTPVPFMDAIFEVCNKTVCAALMAIYAFSPMVATVINLVVLVIAAILLRWLGRRARYYRTMMLDPILSRIWSGFGKPTKPELIVFPIDSIGPFPPKSRLRLCRHSDGDSWELHQANWWSPATVHRVTPKNQPVFKRGWIMHTIAWEGEEGPMPSLHTSRRFDADLGGLADSLGMSLAGDPPSGAVDPQAEFA